MLRLAADPDPFTTSFLAAALDTAIASLAGTDPSTRSGMEAHKISWMSREKHTTANANGNVLAMVVMFRVTSPSVLHSCKMLTAPQSSGAMQVGMIK